MKLLAPASLLLILAAASSTTGCASSCSANAGKLAALKRGMSYEDATQVMGCSGQQVTPNGPDTAEVSTFEWSGPARGMVSRTQLDFRDGHLLSFTTGNRGGW
jgi:hypothetical protein